ncbi:MAG: BRCT domain-containing protein, partial [Clostridia bacterium]|nr:BRCT domain-containing protein [Clostridia bacterium]
LLSGATISLSEWDGEPMSNLVNMEVGDWLVSSSISAWLINLIVEISARITPEIYTEVVEMLKKVGIFSVSTNKIVKENGSIKTVEFNSELKNKEIDCFDEYITEAFIENIDGLEADFVSGMYAGEVKDGKLIWIELEDGFEEELIDEDYLYGDLVDDAYYVLENGGVMNFIIDNFVCEPITLVFKNGKWQVEQKLEGITIAVTGKLKYFDNRDDFADVVKEYGGKVASGVTEKVNYLVTNTPDSNSSKNKKAKELGVEVITEEDFLLKYGLNSYLEDDCDEDDYDEDEE